jgi:energy-coupling factor transporter transmembrane protein EcfT
VDAPPVDPLIHPATRLVLWLLFLIAAQCMNGVTLACALPLFAFFGRAAFTRGLLLAWRARWLLLSVFAVLAWSVAGTPLWNGAASPTFEGVREAWRHSGRLFLILISVGVFLEKTPMPDLMTASQTLFRPLAGFCVVRKAFVRLMLTLRYAEDLPRPKNWRSFIDLPAPDISERVAIRSFPLRGVDRLLISLGVFLLAAAFYFK